MSTWELPLSWSWGPAGAALELRPLLLPSGGQFLHAPRVSEGVSLAELRAALEQSAAEAPLVAQGLQLSQVEALGAGSGSILMGSSARIELAGYRPPHKVRNLAKRATAISVDEVPVAEAGGAQAALELAARGGQATLRYVFRARVEDADRTWVVRVGEQPVGMVSLTHTGGGAWHVELLIRDPQAPDGAMEALLSRAIDVLQGEGQRALDLGQVAFYVEEPLPVGLSPLNRLILAGVPAAVAATGGRFNFEGLRRFKNKFEVTWVPRYFCGWPRLRKRDLRAATDASDLGQFIRPLG